MSAPQLVGAGMTFEEIGEALGITRGGAWMAYRSGINKLRRRGVDLTHLRAMAEELQSNRTGTNESVIQRPETRRGGRYF